MVVMSDQRNGSVLGSKGNGVHARTMLAAAEVLGGLSSLADFLKVSRAELFRWTAGVERPPQALFLLAVDVVLDDNEKLRGDLKIQPRATPGISLPPTDSGGKAP
jgi:hypothetical protein